LCGTLRSDRLSGSVRAGERLDSAYGRQRDDQMQRHAGNVVLLVSAQPVDWRRRKLLAELVDVDVSEVPLSRVSHRAVTRLFAIAL